MASAENTELLSDKDDSDEMVSPRLLHKKVCSESIEKIEGSFDLNIVNKSTADDASVSGATIGKNMEEMLLDSLAREEREMEKLTDSDNQDEEMQLRWDDDDLDEEEVRNEKELLHKGSLDAAEHPLTLKDEVIKSTENEEKLLESEADDSKESPTESSVDNVFVPKIDHNLNKPDMMLEIPSHEIIEFSDDEDLTNNLEMSPDTETDDEVSGSGIPTEEVQAEVLKQETDEEVRMKVDENELEKEARFAADILTKQLNNMDESIITDDLFENYKEINEDVLLKDDEQDELLEDQMDVIEEPFKTINKSVEDTEKTASEFIEDKVQGVEDSCEEMYLETGGNESQELESKDLKSESPDNTTNKMTEIESKDDSTNKIENNESDTVSKLTSNSSTDQSTLAKSVTNENVDTKILDTASIETQKEEENLPSHDPIDKPNIDQVIKESEIDSELSSSNEPEISQKDIKAEKILEKIVITTVDKTLQQSEQIKILQNDPIIHQPMTESLETPEKNLQNKNSEVKDPSPTSDNGSDGEITPELQMSSDESVNEGNDELPAQTVDEPKPETSTCETELRMSLDKSLSETALELAKTIGLSKSSQSVCETELRMSSDEANVELPAQTIDETRLTIFTCETELRMSSDELVSETAVELAQTIVEPKPSTSVYKTELTITSDKSLNETTVDLPAQRIDEPKRTTSTCETKLAKSSDESLNETTVELPAPTIDEPKPSTSTDETKVSEASMFGSMMVQETSIDVPEMTDSLGLLAESSRVMEEDEEQEYDEEGEDEDDSDHDHDDESSNQMTAEHSEDSNAQHSETDQPKEDNNDKNFTFTITDIASEVNKDEAMECDVGETDTPMDIVPIDKIQETNGNDVEVPPEDSAKDNKDAEAMEIETVKLSDTSDNEVDTETMETTILKELLGQDNSSKTEPEEPSPSKTSKLKIVKQNNIMSYVDLEETSSEDDAQETKQETQIQQEEETVKAAEDVVKAVDDKAVEFEPERVLQSSPQKIATSLGEDTNTASDGDAKEIMPNTTIGLEIFNLDSDDDEPAQEEIPDDIGQPANIECLKCINQLCMSDTGVEYFIADSVAINFYDADKKKRGYVCSNCSDAVEKRNQDLISGIKNFTPLLELSMKRSCEELVEISDSESEDEPDPDKDQVQAIGAEGAKVAENVLEQMLNETWIKYKMDDRLAETQNTLKKELDRLQKESDEVNKMFDDCQVATDQLRNELYTTFEPDIRELPSIVIYDTPTCRYSCLEPTAASEQGPMKRTRSPPTEVPTKRPAIPLGYAPLDDKSNDDSRNMKVTSEKAEDDNTDVSVVKLSAESAPKDLPPPGDITMTPIKVGMAVYAMKNAFGTWMKAKVVEIMPKPPNSTFTLCRVKFDHVVSKSPYKVLPARCIAYCDPPDVRMTIGRRVIAQFKDSTKREAYYSGIIAEIPNPVNSYRYLIFFDDGYAQYAHHFQTRLVCECSCLVWEEVHPYSREFVRQYLLAYPERPMVRLHAGQNLKTEWRGKWWSSRVARVDASLVEVQFLRRDRREWIYRGSTRLAPLYLELQAAERARPRAMPRAQPQGRTNMPYVEYTRSDEQTNKSTENQEMQQQQKVQQQQQQNEEMRRQRAVAKKSTTAPPPPPVPSAENLDNVTSRVVYYTPKNAVKPKKMVPHNCSFKCKRSDVLALKDLRTYNPLAKPLLSGWERQIVRWKGQRAVLYVAPCGRRLRSVHELHMYLRTVKSDMPVDLFDFSPATHCLAEFVLNKCLVGKKDLSHGKENVPVPCVNYYDESLPEFCSYNTERTPTAGVPLNLDTDFLCGCDCEDDCQDKTKCACWKMTLEGAKTIGLEGNNVGYMYKRLPEPLPSGIYECNSRCKCKHTCLNRVAQHPLQLKLQVFKTLNRGWGIRALNDVPKGAFLCVYAGNLLTDATANLDGLNEGDEYLAELDYIEVVEQMKEGYEEDIPEDIKKLDKKRKVPSEDAEEEDEQSSEEEAGNNKTDPEDDDFQPGCSGIGVAEFSKRLRQRNSKKKVEKEETDKNEKEKGDKKEGDKEGNQDEDCITISDDEELREPSCFTAAAGMGANEFKSKYRSVRTLFGEDEACYIMDAKVQGNIGRYLNHSCLPNVFVQNVFVDTHDPRFPWVAFFALSHIRAGTELTWNYNYDVGSVPGKVLYCHCGASNCRGRLL